MTPIHFHLVLPNGNPIANATVSIQLSRGAYNAIDDGVALPAETFFVTDSLGKGDLALWPSNMAYYLSAKDPASDAEILFKFVVPNVGAGVIARFQDLIVDGMVNTVPTSAIDYAAFLVAASASMNAAALSAGQAEASAAAAQASAGSITGAVASAAAAGIAAAGSATAAAGSAVAALGSQNAAAVSAAAALSAVGTTGRRMLKIIGSKFYTESGAEFMPRGISDFRWGSTQTADAAYWFDKRANHMRDGLRWFGDYGTGAPIDCRKDSDPGGISLSHMAQVVEQKRLNFVAGLYQIHVFDSDQCQNGFQNASELAYGVLPKWPIDAISPGPWPNGRNVFTDLGLRARKNVALAEYARNVKQYGNVYEIYPEPGPLPVLGVTDQQLIDVLIEHMDAVLAVDPDAIFIVGPQRGYNSKRCETVYIPGRKNIIYTGNLFAFETKNGSPRTIQEMFDNIKMRLQPLLNMRDKYNVPIWIQQFGVNTSVDPDHVLIKMVIDLFNANGVPWTYWEDRGPAAGNYDVRVGAPGQPGVVNTGLLAALQAGFTTALIEAPIAAVPPVINRTGYSVLAACASAGAARCNNLYPVAQPATYSRINGLVMFECKQFDAADKDRLIKLSAPKRPDLTALLVCASAVPSTTAGRTVITAYELYTDDDRPDVALSSVTDGSMICHDLQSNTNTHGHFAKANSYCGGVLDITNMSMGGSNTASWQDKDLRAYIEGMPLFDLAIVDFGYGNDITAPSLSAAGIFARFDDNMKWVCTRARRVLVLGVAGARLVDGSGVPVPNPQLTVEFSTLSQLHYYMRRAIPDRYPNAEFIDVESRFLKASTYGSADTADLVRGEPPAEFIEAGGIHLAPAGNDEVAIALADAILKDTAGLDPFTYSRPDFVYSNSAPDFSGTAYNPNGLYPWMGAVPTVAVTVTGIGAVGTGVEGTTLAGSGFTGTMSAKLSVTTAELGGRGMELLFTDPTDGGATLVLEYQGTSAYPIAQMLNDARFRGLDAAFLADIGVYGFNLDSVGQIDVSLMGTDDIGVTRKLGSFFSDDGSDGMFAADRTWARGFDGPYSAGNGHMRLPTNRTWVRGFIRMTVVSNPHAGFPLGQLLMRIGQTRFAARQQLATPLALSFA